MNWGNYTSYICDLPYRLISMLLPSPGDEEDEISSNMNQPVERESALAEDKLDIIGSVPEELALEIFSYLHTDGMEQIENVSLVNRTWKRIANDPLLWKLIVTEFLQEINPVLLKELIEDQPLDKLYVRSFIPQFLISMHETRDFLAAFGKARGRKIESKEDPLDLSCSFRDNYNRLRREICELLESDRSEDLCEALKEEQHIAEVILSLFKDYDSISRPMLLVCSQIAEAVDRYDYLEAIYDSKEAYVLLNSRYLIGYVVNSFSDILIRSGSIDLIKKILASPYDENFLYSIFLMKSCNFGRADVVRELLILRKEKNISLSSHENCTCCLIASKGGHIECIKELKPLFVKNQFHIFSRCFSYLVEGGFVEPLRQLMQMSECEIPKVDIDGIEVDYDYYMHDRLHYSLTRAIQNNHLECLKILQEYANKKEVTLSTMDLLHYYEEASKNEESHPYQEQVKALPGFSKVRTETFLSFENNYHDEHFGYVCSANMNEVLKYIRSFPYADKITGETLGRGLVCSMPADLNYRYKDEIPEVEDILQTMEILTSFPQASNIPEETLERFLERMTQKIFADDYQMPGFWHDENLSAMLSTVRRFPNIKDLSRNKLDEFERSLKQKQAYHVVLNSMVPFFPKALKELKKIRQFEDLSDFSD